MRVLGYTGLQNRVPDFRYYAIAEGIMALLTRHPGRVKGIEGRRKDLQLTLWLVLGAEKLGELLFYGLLPCAGLIAINNFYG